MPAGTAVEVVETNRGGKSTYHAPGQLVCYPILDLNRHGRDVKKYVRDLEEAVIRTLAAHAIEGERIEGLTGVWLSSPPRKICSIGVHVSRWVTTHGYALNVDLDPAPFTDWITACGLEDAAFTTMARELGRPITVDDVRRGRGGGARRACSTSSWRSCRRRTARGSGRNPSTRRSPDDRRHPAHPAAGLGSAPRRRMRRRRRPSARPRVGVLHRRASLLRARDASMSIPASTTRSSPASRARASRPSATRRCRFGRSSRCAGPRASRTGCGPKAPR